MFCNQCGTHMIYEFKVENLKLHGRVTFVATYDTHPTELAPSWQPSMHPFCKEAVLDLKQWNDGLPKYVTIPAAAGGSDEQI